MFFSGGHRGTALPRPFFVLDLTFIGWILLALCTAGVGMLFVQPYMLTARAAFYDDLKATTIVDDTDNTTEEATAEEVAN